MKDSKLSESYNERSRRGQAFEADLSKYDKKQRATVQKAIDSGILNNTNRTHEFVDMVAKISADKDVSFDFTNNQKLKESGFAIDGKTVNGLVTKDGITINIQSAKALNSVVGHEIAHILEGTELYTELQNSIIEYAKSKGDYQGRYDALTELYKDVKDANIDAELTADLVGDYLFTDSDFINNLSMKNRNVFQKIYDEIKYLCKIATAGSKEARQLEKVMHQFEKALRESTVSSQKTQYQLSKDIDKDSDLGYNENDLYTVSDSFTLEVDKNDRDTFSRSLANKTTGMEQDEIRTVEIIGATKVYFFEATGYMQGRMLKSVSTDNRDGYTRARKEYINEINGSSETFDSWINAFSAYRKGAGSDISDIGIGQGKNDADGIYGRAPELDSTGTQERSGQNFEDDPEEVKSVTKALREEYGYTENHPTNEIAPVKEVSPTDDAFFDAENPQNSLSYKGEHRTLGESKEARDFERIKKASDKAYREGGQEKNNTVTDGSVKYDLQYNDAINQLAKNELDRSKNTHLKLLDHTPQLYIDKVGAKDLKIIMGWDIAYLAMNKSGDLDGNYHGLGPEVMKDIPRALQDPLYIVKQDNGRIAAVTELVVKGNRSTVAVIELDAFKSTTQDGSSESDNYNLIVTVMDAKPNYLQNTILNGDIVYNKNEEDPANFILRLKSLTKATSNDDLARSSVNSIPQNSEKSTENSKKSLSYAGSDIAPVGNYNVYGKDIMLETAEDDIAPVADGVAKNATTTTEAPMPSNATPTSTRLADGTRGDELLNESLDNYPMETVEQKVAENIRAMVIGKNLITRQRIPKNMPF